MPLGFVCCGVVQPRGTSTIVCPESAAESAGNVKLSSLSVEPAVTRFGVDGHLPDPGSTGRA